jgi:hypothetical protein
MLFSLDLSTKEENVGSNLSKSLQSFSLIRRVREVGEYRRQAWRGYV